MNETLEKTELECERTQCKYNNFDATTFGYCRRKKVRITDEGCIYYIKS